jgi:hypothetical protein
VKNGNISHHIQHKLNELLLSVNEAKFISSDGCAMLYNCSRKVSQVDSMENDVGRNEGVGGGWKIV